MKPIPQSPWNDSQVVPGPISAAVTPAGRDSINGGGGGASSCSTSAPSGETVKCTSGYSKPAWQTGTGVPKDGVRDTPDVALMAGPGLNSAAWLYCTDDRGTCALESGGAFYFGGVGGTSASAPAFAGMLAMVVQKPGGRLGQAATGLYALYNSSHANSVFNDITAGNNSPPCQMPTASIPSPDCVKNAAGNYFESGYNAGPGYDHATGLGTVNATNLVNFWGDTGTVAATVTVTPAATSVFRGSSLSVSVAVSGASGTPSGSVTLTSGSYTSATATLASGKATIVIAAGTLPAGADTLTVTYSGDSKFESAKGIAKVTVTVLTPKVTVTPAAAKVGRPGSLSIAVAVAGTSGIPTGTVTLSGGGYTSTAKALVSGKATIVIPGSTLTIGADKLTAAYSGGGDYGSATGIATVTVAKVTPVVTVTPAHATTPRESALSVAVLVKATAGTPTGTVTLSGGGYNSAATPLTGGKATIVIPANKLTVAKDTLSVTYHGDANDNTATGRAPVTVIKLTPTVTVTPAESTVARASTLSVTVKVVSTAGPTAGLVRIGSGGYSSNEVTLVDGKATIVIPADRLVIGADTITALFSSTPSDNPASGTANVKVVKLTPTVNVKPASTSIASDTSLSVPITVVAAAGVPTGSVTLSGGGYTSVATELSLGKVVIVIPANKLTVGTDILTVTYAGDGDDNVATGKAQVVVSK